MSTSLEGFSVARLVVRSLGFTWEARPGQMLGRVNCIPPNITQSHSQTTLSLIPRPLSVSFRDHHQSHSKTTLSLIPRPISASFPDQSQPHSQTVHSKTTLSLIPRPLSASFPDQSQPHSQTVHSQTTLSLIPRPLSVSFPDSSFQDHSMNLKFAVRNSQVFD